MKELRKLAEAVRDAKTYEELVFAQTKLDDTVTSMQLISLLDRLEKAEKDAARYRAIREGLEVDPDNSGIFVSLTDDFGGETLRGDQADAAIDAAMEAK